MFDPLDPLSSYPTFNITLPSAQKVRLVSIIVLAALAALEQWSHVVSE